MKLLNRALFAAKFYNKRLHSYNSVKVLLLNEFSLLVAVLYIVTLYDRRYINIKQVEKITNQYKGLSLNYVT